MEEMLHQNFQKKNTENKNYPNKIEERNKTTEIVLYSRAHL